MRINKKGNVNLIVGLAIILSVLVLVTIGLLSFGVSQKLYDTLPDLGWEEKYSKEINEQEQTPIEQKTIGLSQLGRENAIYYPLTKVTFKKFWKGDDSFIYRWNPTINNFEGGVQTLVLIDQQNAKPEYLLNPTIAPDFQTEKAEDGIKEYAYYISKAKTQDDMYKQISEVLQKKDANAEVSFPDIERETDTTTLRETYTKINAEEIRKRSHAQYLRDITLAYFGPGFKYHEEIIYPTQRITSDNLWGRGIPKIREEGGRTVHLKEHLIQKTEIHLKNNEVVLIIDVTEDDPTKHKIKRFT